MKFHFLFTIIADAVFFIVLKADDSVANNKTNAAVNSTSKGNLVVDSGRNKEANLTVPVNASTVAAKMASFNSTPSFNNATPALQPTQPVVIKVETVPVTIAQIKTKNPEKEDPSSAEDPEGPGKERDGEEDSSKEVDEKTNTNTNEESQLQKVIKQNTADSPKNEKTLLDDDEPENSHFMRYFLIVCVFVAVSYVAFYKRKRILAYLIEGKRRSSSERKNVRYRKLRDGHSGDDETSEAKGNVIY